jgi:hypothetical protein
MDKEGNITNKAHLCARGFTQVVAAFLDRFVAGGAISNPSPGISTSRRDMLATTKQGHISTSHHLSSKFGTEKHEKSLTVPCLVQRSKWHVVAALGNS